MYERRTVAFLDLLGFKRAIQRAENNLWLLLRVREALQSITTYASVSKSGLGGSLLPGAYAQSFSDNIVICGQSDWVFYQVTKLIRELFTVGFAVRGGITVGNIYYADGLVFG